MAKTTRINLDAIRKLQAGVRGIASRYDDAVVMAAVSVHRKAVPLARQAIEENFGVKASAITGARGGPPVRASVNNGTKGETLTIWASTKRVPLVLFSGAWGGPNTVGATAQIERGSTRTYQSAFISPGRLNGKVARLIYMRTKEKKIQKAGRYKGKNRQSIIAMQGPSPYAMLRPTDYADKAALRAQKSLLAQLTDFYISELRRQAARK